MNINTLKAIYFIGAGPGPVDLITVKGKSLIEKADLIVYPEPPINLELLDYAKAGCELYNSAGMPLEKIVVEMVAAAQKGKLVVQLVAGDAKVCDAKNEQISLLRSYDLEYEVVFGVSK